MRLRRDITDVCLAALGAYVFFSFVVPLTHACRGGHSDCLRTDTGASCHDDIGARILDSAELHGSCRDCLICLHVKTGNVMSVARKAYRSIPYIPAAHVLCDTDGSHPVDPSRVSRPFRGPPA